jgi:hypothetical protein
MHDSRTIFLEKCELEDEAKEPDKEPEEHGHGSLEKVPRNPVRGVVEAHRLQRLAKLELTLRDNLVHLNHEGKHGACGANGKSVHQNSTNGNIEAKKE